MDAKPCCCDESLGSQLGSHHIRRKKQKRKAKNSPNSFQYIDPTTSLSRWWFQIFLFPNSFSYGVFANIGSGAASGGRFREVPGRFRGRFRITGSGKVPGQVPNDRFREGSGAGSESRVPGRFRGRFRTTGSGKFREGSGSVFRTTGSRKVPGQVPNHGFREGSGAGSERQVPGRFRSMVPNHGFREGSGAGSEPRVPGRFRGRF